MFLKKWKLISTLFLGAVFFLIQNLSVDTMNTRYKQFIKKNPAFWGTVEAL